MRRSKRINRKPDDGKVSNHVRSSKQKNLDDGNTLSPNKQQRSSKPSKLATKPPKPARTIDDGSKLSPQQEPSSNPSELAHTIADANPTTKKPSESLPTMEHYKKSSQIMENLLENFPNVASRFSTDKLREKITKDLANKATSVVSASTTSPNDAALKSISSKSIQSKSIQSKSTPPATTTPTSPQPSSTKATSPPTVDIIVDTTPKPKSASELADLNNPSPSSDSHSSSESTATHKSTPRIKQMKPVGKLKSKKLVVKKKPTVKVTKSSPPPPAKKSTTIVTESPPLPPAKQSTTSMKSPQGVVKVSYDAFTKWGRNCTPKPNKTDFNDNFLVMPSLDIFKENLDNYKNDLKNKGYYRADIIRHLCPKVKEVVMIKSNSENSFLCGRYRCGTFDTNYCPFNLTDCCHHIFSLKINGTCLYATKGFLRCYFFKTDTKDPLESPVIEPKWNLNVDVRNIDNPKMVNAVNHFIGTRVGKHYHKSHQSVEKPPLCIGSYRARKLTKNNVEVINRAELHKFINEGKCVIK